MLNLEGGLLQGCTARAVQVLALTGYSDRGLAFRYCVGASTFSTYYAGQFLRSSKTYVIIICHVRGGRELERARARGV